MRKKSRNQLDGSGWNRTILGVEQDDRRTCSGRNGTILGVERADPRGGGGRQAQKLGVEWDNSRGGIGRQRPIYKLNKENNINFRPGPTLAAGRADIVEKQTRGASAADCLGAQTRHAARPDGPRRNSEVRRGANARQKPTNARL